MLGFLWKKKDDTGPQGQEFRRHKRYPGRGHSVEINGVHYEVKDYSDGGVAIITDPRRAPDWAVIRLMQNGRLLRETVAIRSWGHRGTVGYKYTPIPIMKIENLNAEDDSPSTDPQTRRRYALFR